MTACHGVINIVVLFFSCLSSCSYLQLIRSRYQTHCESFHLEQLKKDILINFIVGKPIIIIPKDFKEVFRFKR